VQDQQLPNRAQIDDGDITSFEVGGIHPHELKMDQQLYAAALSHGPVARFTTLCAVAASKFDLTVEPYDLIIRLSSQKPACMCRTYWRVRARHYRVAGNDARVAAGHERVRRSPGTLTTQIPGEHHLYTQCRRDCRRHRYKGWIGSGMCRPCAMATARHTDTETRDDVAPSYRH